MTSSAVFLDANSVDGLTSSVPDAGTDALMGTIFGADPVDRDAADTPVPVAVASAACRLIQLVTDLRSPGGGWPSDLPQTPEHLSPYIAEEVEELKAVLRQSAAEEDRAEAVPSLWSLLEQVPRWLWEMATTSYEAMRLLEGVKTRIYLESGEFRWGVVRLAPVMGLTTATHRWTLDLVTQTQADAGGMAEAVRFQLIDSDLDPRSMTVSELKGALHHRFERQSAILNRLLNQGELVTALVPGHPWQTGRLQLSLTLVETTEAPLDILDALPEGGSADQPMPDEANVLSAWITLTDEAWIQAFLEVTAVRALCRQLAAQAEALDLPEAAFNAVSQILGSNGLFKQTFVHQPMLVADLWPRLRWYLTRCSVLVMQLMGGRSASVLVPDVGWRYGTLYLKALLWLEIEGQSWRLDCANGEAVVVAPDPLPATAVVMLSGEALPTQADQLSYTLAQDLTRHMPGWAELTQGIAVEFHPLDSVQLQEGRLKLDWRLTLV